MTTLVQCELASNNTCRVTECVHYQPHQAYHYGEHEVCTAETFCSEHDVDVICKLVVVN